MKKIFIPVGLVSGIYVFIYQPLIMLVCGIVAIVIFISSAK